MHIISSGIRISYPNNNFKLEEVSVFFFNVDLSFVYKQTNILKTL